MCKKLPRKGDIQKVELGQKYVPLGVLDASAYLVVLPPKFHRWEWRSGKLGPPEARSRIVSNIYTTSCPFAKCEEGIDRTGILVGNTSPLFPGFTGFESRNLFRQTLAKMIWNKL